MYKFKDLNTFDVRFNNNVKDKPFNEYLLSIKSFLSETKILSDTHLNNRGSEDYSPIYVPNLYPENSKYCCQITVKNNKGNPSTANYVSYGTIHFKYNPNTKEVEYITDGYWPKNLEIKKDHLDALTISINYENY